MLWNDRQEQQPVGNWFSEIHGNEIREVECSKLNQIKCGLDNNLLIINGKMKILSNKIQHLIDIIQPNERILIIQIIS